ncbi:MAG: FAD-linked oxidase C-terminal domain-containing protein [Bacillota bacterium]|nr:FAD-linked oxidase C-terminal domain-containing protein [Bacillota bacterium]
MKGLIKDLIHQISPNQVLKEPEDLLAYANDATHYYKSVIPDAVVLPHNTEDVAKVMKYASQQNIPVTPRGAGSGLAGGCTPVNGGIVLDMKRMNHLLEIDKGNMTATVEGGVVLGNFQRAVERQNMFYPPDPQSMKVCTLGGNVATRAGGPRAVKYGTTGNYVLGMEIVLPDGSIIHTGGKFVKQSVGYDLTHLMTGSEGTLGVISAINLRLLPLPEEHKTMVVVCETLDQAAEIVSEIIANGAVPSMLEFLIKLAITVFNTYLSPPLPDNGEGFLLMELDGTTEQINRNIGIIQEICQNKKATEIRVIHDHQTASVYWNARANMYPFMMTIFRRVITEDITVPRNLFPQYVRSVQEIAASTGVAIGLGGHAGDGNVHPTIMQSEISSELAQKSEQAIDMLIKAGLELGGTISGEHGIGIHKKQYLEWEIGTVQIELMKKIKQCFDPLGIMNPGKIWVEGGVTND